MTNTHLLFLLRGVVRSLWFTPAIYAVAALAVLVVAPLVAPFIPDGLRSAIGLTGVGALLDVLAGSLLAVAIFSLGIMATSLQVAAQSATPRARPLLMEDRVAQNAISTFLGGFIFAIVGIVGLSTAYYSDAARVLLFLVTCLVILAVVVNLIRWIARLSSLGDVMETVDLVRNATRAAFRDAAQEPDLGGRSATAPPQDGFPVLPGTFGFVQAIDAERLGACADALSVDLHLLARPGVHLDPARPMLVASRPLDDDAQDRLRGAFVIGSQRTFHKDPRFGLIVLSEIASRALSPGVNDPGTAIDVIGTSVGVLADWSNLARAAAPEVRHPRLHVPPLDVDDLLGDAFRWIARDGARQLEVHIRLQKGLAALAALDEPRFGKAARALSDEALARAEAAMDFPQDIERLREIAGRIGRAGSHAAAAG